MEQVTRKGLHSGVQSEFTIIAPIKPGEGSALRADIHKISQDPKRFEAVKSIGTLHESRMVLLDNDTRFMFLSTFDGSWDKYIDDFATTKIRDYFQLLFSHCEEFPGVDDPNTKDWFMKYAIEAETFLSAYPNTTVRQIWQGLAVVKAFEEVLDDPKAEQVLQDPALKPLLDLAGT